MDTELMLLTNSLEEHEKMFLNTISARHKKIAGKNEVEPVKFNKYEIELIKLLEKKYGSLSSNYGTERIDLDVLIENDHYFLAKVIYHNKFLNIYFSFKNKKLDKIFYLTKRLAEKNAKYVFLDYKTNECCDVLDKESAEQLSHKLK